MNDFMKGENELMNTIEVIQKLYEEWKSWKNINCANGESLDTHNNEIEKRYMFLSDAIVGLTTYDDNQDILLGKMISETLVQIKNKTTFEYIKKDENYKNYILSCNYILKWLDWGTSIRGAWFNINDGKIFPSEPLSNVGYDKEYIEISEEFIDWFVDFIDCKVS